MQVRLNRAEYWLLETVVDLRCPLFYLDPNDKKMTIEETFNKPGHGLDRVELIEVLVQLAERGLIEGFEDEGPIALDRRTIISGLAELPPRRNRSCTAYQLTQKRGAVWEAFAAPDWSRLVTEELDDDTRTGTLTGMVSWRVETYLRYLDMLQCELDLQSIRFEETGSWEATYWKTLPDGHRAQFRWRHRREPSVGNDFPGLAFSGF